IDEEVVEELIAALRPDVVEILMSGDTLRQMTTSDVGLTAELFTFLREGLFTELGVRYPRFRFSPAPTLKPNSFAFTINHLTTLPLTGLHPDQCLVNDTAKRLHEQNIDAEEAANFASGQPGGLVKRSDQKRAEDLRLTTWNQGGYFILCFAAVLR